MKRLMLGKLYRILSFIVVCIVVFCLLFYYLRLFLGVDVVFGNVRVIGLYVMFFYLWVLIMCGYFLGGGI